MNIPINCFGGVMTQTFSNLFLYERVVGEGGGFACCAFVTRVQGALKKVEEGEVEGVGEDAWES